MLCNGEGVAQDMTEGAKWIRKSADQGWAEAQYVLGICYNHGIGVAKDLVEAAKWWRKAADQGNAEAAKSLDSLNRMTPSKGTPAPETTVTTLDGARVIITKKGNVTNYETVGNLSPNTAFTGNTLAEIKPENNPVDLLIRAVELFPQNKRAAYLLGLAASLRAKFDLKRVADRTAHQAIGVLFMQPDNERVLDWGAGSQTIGVEESRAVLEWARKSGPPSYHPAWMIQHGMHAFGATGRPGAGISAGFVAATAWSEVLDDYAKFIDRPSMWVARQERNNPANYPAQLKMMESDSLSVFDSGPAGDVGRQKLRAVVVGFDFKAADPTLAFLDARDAMRAIVATAYSTPPANSTPPVSKEGKAFESCKAKAEQGDSEAQYRLGFIYEQGRGVPVDYVESASWWRKAADQGHAGAQFSLGYCYERGEGVPRNPSEAAKWLHKSADQGNAAACRFLGIAYDRGDGVRVDKIEAYAYLTIALPGDSNAGGLLDSMTRGMTPSAIQKGKLRAKELQKEIDDKIAKK
jgi:TPR repeat protein